MTSRVAASGRYAIVFRDLSRDAQLLVSRGQLGGTASKPVQIGSDLAAAYEAEAAVANDGTVYVLYFELFKKRPKSYELALAILPPHKKHATIERLGSRLKTPNSRSIEIADIALDTNGRVAIGYVTESKSLDTARVIFREPGGAYGARTRVARSKEQGSLDAPMMSFDEAGGLLAVVNRGGVGCDTLPLKAAARCKPQLSTAFSARVLPNGSVSHQQELDGEGDCSADAVASHPDGSSMVALVCASTSRNSRLSIEYASSSGTGAFSAVRALTLPSSKDDAAPELVPIRGGRFMAIWNHDVKSVTNDGDYTDQILGTVVAADGTVSPSKALTPPVARSAVEDDFPEIRPQLVVARDGVPYLSTALAIRDRQQIAHIRDDLTLGPAIVTSPSKTAEATIRVSEAGLGLSLWLVERRSGFFFGTTEFTLPTP